MVKANIDVATLAASQTALVPVKSEASPVRSLGRYCGALLLATALVGGCGSELDQEEVFLDEQQSEDVSALQDAVAVADCSVSVDCVHGGTISCSTTAGRCSYWPDSCDGQNGYVTCTDKAGSSTQFCIHPISDHKTTRSEHQGETSQAN